MNTQEIWVQGHRVNGENHPAVLLASIEAETFDDALAELIETDETFARHFDRRDHKFWGCTVFATEEKARGRFG